MSRTILAVVASAAALAACGTPPPTAVDNPVRVGEGTLSTQQISNACGASSLAVSYTPVASRRLITAVFLDARGNDVAPVGCAPLVWSVTPQGATVQPLFDGSREITQAELIVTGATQVYTVTATSGSLTDSIGITAGR
jgi:hypothetical protein